MTRLQSSLTIAQILKWADQHHDWTGQWPISRSGPVLGENGRTWEGVDTALRKGGSGLAGGSSLARLLEQRRGVRFTRRIRPGLTIKQILQWADEHRLRTGQWPTRDCGPVSNAPDLTWGTVDRYLKRGDINFPGGSSLSLLLRDARHVWDGGKPRLTESLVLRWAREHFDRFGRWPVTMSGTLYNHADEDWAAIDMALRHRRRGFPYATSLSKLLNQRFGDDYQRHIGVPKDKPQPTQPRRITVRRAG